MKGATENRSISRKRYLVSILIPAIVSPLLISPSFGASVNTDISAALNNNLLEIHTTNDATTGPLVTTDISINVGDTLTITIFPQGYATDSVTVSSNSSITFSSVEDNVNTCENASGIGPNACLYVGVATASLNSTPITITLHQREPGPTYFVISEFFNLTVIDPNTPAQSSTNSNSDMAALAAAEAKRKAEIVAAKTSLLDNIKAIKSPTLAEYRAADYGVTQQATVDRINTQVLEMQTKTPNVALTEAQILPVVQKESFVEYVSTEVTQGRVNSRQLIDNSIITSDYKFRASVLRAIKSASVNELNTYAKIKAVADAEIASIQARKDRLEAIIKKISGAK